MRNNGIKYSCYLSGPIENLQDNGISWRRKFVQLIQDEKLPVEVFDPTDKQNDLFSEINKERNKIQILKQENRFQDVKSIMKKIRRWDLRAVDKSDFLVAYIDKHIPSVGTWDEIITCERQQKPILVIAQDGKMSIPDWSFAIFEEKYIFDSIDACILFINKVCNNQLSVDDKWMLISGL